MGKKENIGETDMPQQKEKRRRQAMEFNFAGKMETMCHDMLTAKKDRVNRCKEIVQETHNFLEGFRQNFLQPVREDFQTASDTFRKFAKECARVH